MVSLIPAVSPPHLPCTKGFTVFDRPADLLTVIGAFLGMNHLLAYNKAQLSEMQECSSG